MGEGTLVLTGVGENENEVVWVMFWAAVKLKREKAAQDKRRDMAVGKSEGRSEKRGWNKSWANGLTNYKYKYNIHERFPWDPVMLGQRSVYYNLAILFESSDT